MSGAYRLQDDMAEVVRLREEEGWTLEEIGAAFGYTREWVRLVLLEYEEATGRRVVRPRRETARERAAREARERAESREQARRAAAVQHVGQRYGALVVTEITYGPSPSGAQNVWHAVVRCDCGVVSNMELRNVIRKNRSCGSKVHNLRGWTRARGSAPPNVVSIPEDYP